MTERDDAADGVGMGAVFILFGAGFAAFPDEWWYRPLLAWMVLYITYRIGGGDIPAPTPYDSDANIPAIFKNYLPPPPAPSVRRSRLHPTFLDVALLLVGMGAAALPLPLGWRWMIMSFGIYLAFKVGGRRAEAQAKARSSGQGSVRRK